MTIAEPRVKRPPELTAIVVLTYVSAIVDIVSGLLIILARYDADIQQAGLRQFVTITGAIIVLFGFLTVAIASGIARGDRHARLILTVLLALGILLAAASMFTVTLDDLWFPIVDVVFSAVVIVVTWTGRTARFFGRQAA
jgi:hypothetical protein